MKNNGNILKKILGRPIAYHAIHAEITGSVTAGLLLSQICYWQSTKEGEFYKTNQDICEETGMTAHEVKSAKKKIQKLPFVSIETKGVPCRTFYRIDFDALHIFINNLANPVGDNPSNQLDGIRPTGTTESTQLDGGNPPNQSDEIPPTSRTESDQLYITETTTENNTENNTESAREKKNDSLIPKNPKKQKKEKPAPREFSPQLISYLENPTRPDFIWDAFDALIDVCERQNLHVNFAGSYAAEHIHHAMELFDLLRVHKKIPQDGSGLSNQVTQFIEKLPRWYVDKFDLSLIVKKFSKILNEQKSSHHGNSKRDYRDVAEKQRAGEKIYF